MRFSALPETKKQQAFAQSAARNAPRGIKALAKADSHRGKATMTQDKRREKHQAVHTAKKRMLRRYDNQAPVRTTRPYVFVGNLRSTITVSRLQELFAPCGEILDVVIRCSLGSVVTADSKDNSIDLWYASVTFSGLSAAKQALALTGTDIDGRKIVVTKLPGELPEVLRKAQMRLGLPNRLHRVPNRLAAEPTLLIDPSDRHNIFGVSFAKCIL